MTLGHVSARHPDAEHLHMKPKGLGLEEVSGTDIIVIDFEGNKLAGDRQRHGEFPIHTEIYRNRRDVNCVIHTHPIYSVALGATGGRIRPIGHEGALFTDLPIFKETTDLIKTREQGQALTACLGLNRAALMQNHGVVVVGISVEEATLLAIFLEKAIKVQLLAGLMGTPVWSPENECRSKAELHLGQNLVREFWEYYVRRLG
jgi:ribulose-5-phosphate 4-epimerase/fuculose-1-phosphate aldolase